jgi:N-glycosylase/DNA lyase
MGVIECPELDLGLTLNSGQAFHWLPAGSGYEGCIGNRPYRLRQEGNLLHFRGGDEATLRHYLALDHDLEAIRSSVASHPVCRTAAIACRGLRILRQPHWECLATFILSPMKQVAHISKMSLALRANHGKKLRGSKVPAFPDPSVLASLSENDLRRCGLGFRAKHLLETSKRVASGEFLPENIATLPTEEARKALCSLPGIGRKVANCILLFSYERLESVPVDVWIGRILESFRKRKAGSLVELERYGERLLGPYAGYIQQYLFHQARKGLLRIPGKGPKTIEHSTNRLRKRDGSNIRRHPR